MMHKSSNAFSQYVNHLNRLSGFYGHASVVLSIVGMPLTSAETTLIETYCACLAGRTYPKIVLNYSISKKLCFKVNNMPLKMNRIIC